MKSKLAVGLFMSLPLNAYSADLNYTSNQDYIKVFLMLILIVGLIFACAWLVRRMSGGLGVNQRHIQVLSVMPLGTREKLMIIKAAHEYLLIGVTPNGISTLHRYDEPIDMNNAIQRSPFADRLKGLLKGEERESNSTTQGSTPPKDD
ncbi:MAG: flagellar protein FliO/FliZ [Reinekea sp.]|jgi:flagellar protein FliO/FliZ|uniref:flagellar biosynthetic protein FliO n=2 Tax=Reinekea sp. TaxID=1970455 RepID=UPI0039897163